MITFTYCRKLKEYLGYYLESLIDLSYYYIIIESKTNS